MLHDHKAAETEAGVIILRKVAHLTARMVDRLRELAIETQTRDHVWIGDLVQ